MKTKKAWCKHIQWAPYVRKWWVLQGWLNVEKKWKFCPICGTPKPKRLTSKPA